MLGAMASVAFADSKQDGKPHKTKEEVALSQAEFIAKKLNLNDANTQRFVTTYCQYQKDVWALGKFPFSDSDKLTDAEAKKEIEAGFEHSQKMLNLRKKYYAEYSKFLTPKQILKSYKLERKLMDRLFNKHHKERPKK